MRVTAAPNTSLPSPRHADSEASHPCMPVKSDRAAALAVEVRKICTPAASLKPTYRWDGVAARSAIAEFAPLLNWVSCRSPVLLGATRLHSSRSHCWGSPPFAVAGLHDQSCGPVVVLRAANRRAPNCTLAGTPFCAGSSAARMVLSTVGDVLAVHAGAEGVAFAQFVQPDAVQGDGSGVRECAMPPLLAT